MSNPNIEGKASKDRKCPILGGGEISSAYILKEHQEALIISTIPEIESSGLKERMLIYWLYQRSLKMFKPRPATNAVHIIKTNK